MFSLSTKITDYLIFHKIICEEDKDLYIFGIDQGFFSLLNLTTTIFIGMWFGMIWEGFVFTIAYLSLRSYSGGYHACSQIKCYILSTVIIICFFVLFKICSNWSHNIILILCGIASVIILILSPFESSNKPLDHLERLVYRKRTIMILTIQLVAVLVNILDVSLTICLSITFVSILLLAAEVQKIFDKNV